MLPVGVRRAFQKPWGLISGCRLVANLRLGQDPSRRAASSSVRNNQIADVRLYRKLVQLQNKQSIEQRVANSGHPTGARQSKLQSYHDFRCLMLSDAGRTPGDGWG